jgi:hypothetical protein
MVLTGNMGRWKRDGNHSLPGNHSFPKNKLVQDSEWNEENGYPNPDSNKTKINYTKEPKWSPQEYSERRNPESN